METRYAVYLGKEQQNGFTGFHAEKNFFCIVEIFDGYTIEQGEDLMNSLAQAGDAAFDSLTGFEASISGILRRHNVPMDTSVAAGYIRDGVLYLKTSGSGEVYIQRGKSTERIITGTTIASGKFQQHDRYIFTSTFFSESLKGIQRIKTAEHQRKSIDEIPDVIKSELQNEDDTGAVSLIIEINESVATVTKTSDDIEPQKSAVIPSVVLPAFAITPALKKNVVIALLCICAAVLIWNGIQMFVTKKSSISPLADTSKVEKLLEEAQNEKDDRSKALDLIGQVRDELKLLKKSEETTALTEKVTTLENEVLARETKESQEYYDLTIEKEQATGTLVNLSDDTLFILDPSGKEYALSLSKKSFEKRTYTKKFSPDSYVAGYEKRMFVYEPVVGVIELLPENKSKVLIKKDDALKQVGGLHVYNGNIYILERGDGNIYKYLVFSDGFSDKTSYFKGSYDVIDDSSTFAIDSAVYIASKTGITKYVSGLKEKTQFVYPKGTIEMTKVIAHPDDEGVYVWDRKLGVVYVFSKEGSYTKQIYSSSLQKASDIEVWNKGIFLMKGSKVLRIAL